jgi:hypothetical protein
MALKNTPLNQQGRFILGGTTDTSDPTKLGWWDKTNFTYQNDDILLTITPKYHNRPDLVAFDAYGKSSYMWLVLQYNNIIDPSMEFVIGAQIRIPSSIRVMSGMK